MRPNCSAVRFAWQSLQGRLMLSSVSVPAIMAVTEHQWLDNDIGNLEWSTGHENEGHAHRTGLRHGRGSQSNSNAKLTPAQVVAIRTSTAPIDDPVGKFDVARSTVRNAQTGKTLIHQLQNSKIC